MLTYHPRCSVAFSWEHFHKKCSWTSQTCGLRLHSYNVLTFCSQKWKRLLGMTPYNICVKYTFPLMVSIPKSFSAVVEKNLPIIEDFIIHEFVLPVNLKPGLKLHGSASTLAQLMGIFAWRYQCWLDIYKVKWHSPFISPRGQWVTA